MFDIHNARILVTGATGRVGSQVIYELRRRGIRPIAHVRAGSDTWYVDSLGLEKRSADLRNQQELHELVAGVDAVIHTAAWISFRGDRLTQFTGLNTFGAVNLYAAAARAQVKRFVHLSSITTIGGTPFNNGDAPEPMTEQTPYNLEDLHIPYFMSKHSAEVELLKLGNGKTELVIANPSIIIAPLKDGNNERQGDRFLRWPLMPNFGNVINLVDIRDVAPGVVAALEKGRDRERYILGGDDITFRELVLAVSALVNRVPHLVAPHRAWFKWYAKWKYAFDRTRGASKIEVYPDLMKLLDYHWSVSSAKARKELGYTFRSLHTSLEDLLHNNFVGTYIRQNS